MSSPAIVGVGAYLPPTIRLNDDPIYKDLSANPKYKGLFDGYDERRVIGADQGLVDLMVPACQRALDAAGLAPSAVDLFLGYGSVGEYQVPNMLAQAHAQLGLRADAPPIPIAVDYNNFNYALLMADALLKGGRYRTALVACASDWTRYMDYTTPESVSASDGAGAAVMSLTDDPARFRVMDVEVFAQTANYGQMYMAGDPYGDPKAGLFKSPTFHITDDGFTSFKTFGLEQPPQAVNRLLARNGIDPKDVTVACHQTALEMVEAWKTAMGGPCVIQTIAEYANMTCASVPVNLAMRYDCIATDFLVSLQIGGEMQTSALLLRRRR